MVDVAKTLYEDAYGLRCRVPVQCDECNGTGTEYGETCLRCGGRGDYCEADESNG
jgi:DnaJ-class molecular chaperone